MPDRVAGLDAGADDYLVKPFAFDELLARVRALLRRARPLEADILRFADLALDPATREVSRGNRLIELTTKEYDLLEYFLRHPRQVLSRDQLFMAVWGSHFLGSSNVIDVRVMAACRTFNAAASSATRPQFSCVIGIINRCAS